MVRKFNNKLLVKAIASWPSVGDPVMYQVNPDAKTRSWKDATATKVSDKTKGIQTSEGKTVK